MSYVTSLMVVSNYNIKEFEKVIRKIIEIAELNEQDTDRLVGEHIPNLKSVGDKSVQFSDLLFFGINYFPFAEFEEWFYEQKFKDVQVFYKKERDERINEL